MSIRYSAQWLFAFASMLCAAALFCLPPAAYGNEGKPELSPAEQELVTLKQAYEDAQKKYWKQSRQYETAEEYKAARDSGELVNPDDAFIPKLLDFEATHRGEGVGINALMHVFNEAGRGGHPDGASHVGARQAAQRLKEYAASPLLPRAVRAACCFSLHSQPEVSEALLALPSTESMTDSIRKCVRFSLARRTLEINRYLPSTITWLERLESGESEPQYPGQIEQTERRVANLPSIEVSANEAKAAMETLRELASDDDLTRIPRSKGVDKRWHVVRVRPDIEGPLVSEVAAALLFKEEHLVKGAEAPDLKVDLLNGGVWRMADQRGKVVVVQFSHTGCGPCERMYPGMAEIVAEHGDAVSLLTLMRDETPDVAQKKIEEGKLTWNISLDGKPGRVTRAWSVDGFPTVYVIDQQGRIDSEGLRGEDLSERVDELLAGE